MVDQCGSEAAKPLSQAVSFQRPSMNVMQNRRVYSVDDRRHVFLTSKTTRLQSKNGVRQLVLCIGGSGTT
jgi:hypothetical protein